MKKVVILKDSRWSLGGNIIDITKDQELECTEKQANELISAGFADAVVKKAPTKKEPVENKAVTEEKAPAKKKSKK